MIVLLLKAMMEGLAIINRRNLIIMRIPVYDKNEQWR